MPAVGRVVSRPWYEVGRFLGPSISSFYDHHPMTEQILMWRAAGIEVVQYHPLTFKSAVVIWGTKGNSHGR